MEQVGYETYTKLLEENIKELKGEKIDVDKNVIVDILVDAYIPDTFIKKQKYKMDIYQEIIYCKNNAKLKEVVKDLIDRYGEFPTVLKNFVKIIILRNMAQSLGISKIIENKSEYVKNTVNIHITEEFDINKVELLIKTYKTRINFKKSKDIDEKGIIEYKYKDPERKIEEIHAFLNILKLGGRRERDNNKEKERYEKKEYLVEGIKIVYEYIKSKLSNAGNNNSKELDIIHVYIREELYNKYITKQIKVKKEQIEYIFDMLEKHQSIADKEENNDNPFKIFLLKENVFNKITNDVNPEGLILKVKMPNKDNILLQNVIKKDNVNDINNSIRIVFENISDPRKSRNYNKNSSSNRT